MDIADLIKQTMYDLYNASKEEDMHQIMSTFFHDLASISLHILVLIVRL